MESNLDLQVIIGEARLTVMGSTMNLSEQMKVIVQSFISQQVSVMQSQMTNSPMFEQAVRAQWLKMCSAIPLGSGPGTAPVTGPGGAPNLWLVFRPTQALSAQPLINQNGVTVSVGVRAQTSVVTVDTKPDCPFPAQLEIVPQMDQGQVNIDLPIDMPFADVNRLIEAQVKGKSFPLDKGGTFTATIRSAKLAPSGDRLLFTTDIRADETNTWLRFGADGTVYVWGKPVLDRTQQLLRFDNIELDVQSEAVFGALGFAAQAAAPYLQKMLADHAEIDLSPLMSNVRRNIEDAVTAFQKNADGTQLEAQVRELRLAGVEFDAKTLRVIVSAEGTARVVVTKLGSR